VIDGRIFSMITNRRRVLLFLILLVIAGVLYYASSYNYKPIKTGLGEDENRKYVLFDLEVYDKISKIYWSKTTEADLSGLFKQSLEKVLGTSTPLITKDRKGIEEMLTKGIALGTTTEAKKQIAVNVAIVALYNIAPAGRNQIFSQKQEKAFRETVANVNPQKDLYADVGVSAGSSIEEVAMVSKKEIDKLKNSTSTEDKAKIEKIKYATSVLTNPDNKSLYDEAKIEPTLKYRKIGKTFYADLSQIAPTTLFELVKAIDNASTTKDINTLIIDFRGNIGGSLDFLPAFFGLFVGKDQYVFDLFHQDKYEPQRTTQPKYPQFERFTEVAILTDNMTQSTAELTSSVFKKFNMAKVVGKTTRGWGTVENTYPMETEIDPNEKFILLLVNSITLREDGQPIEGRGVDPDIDISKAGWQKQLSIHFKSQSLIDAIRQVIK
jgi:hypothetical protein